MLQNGTLWTSQTIGVTDTGVASGSATRNGVRWYQIGSPTTTPTVVQSGTLFTAGSPGNLNLRNYWVPSIATSTSGRTLIGFSGAGSNEFVNAGVAERFSSDAANTLRAPELYTSSPAAYNPPGGSRLADARSAMGRRLVDRRRWLRRFHDLDAAAVHRRGKLLRAGGRQDRRTRCADARQA